MKVWLVEAREKDCDCVHRVASSEEKAVEWLRANPHWLDADDPQAFWAVMPYEVDSESFAGLAMYSREGELLNSNY